MRATPWRKSSFSAAAANCVEVRAENNTVQVRDSKAEGGARLDFSAPEWEAFLAGVRAGEFDFVPD
jgi:Domain of unknown function (DUF397)